MALSNKDDIYIPNQKNNQGKSFKETKEESIEDLVEINESRSEEPIDIDTVIDNESSINSIGDLNELLEDIDIKEVKRSESESVSNTKSEYKPEYKGVKNYAANVDKIETINVQAEVIESSSSLTINNKDEGDRKRSGRALPYADMFSFYVKGEKVIQGSMKYTTTPTYQDVADKFACSKESVEKTARKQKWVKKRKAYREKLQGDFSFYGQLAADINGKVLHNSGQLMDRVQSKLNHPTFMPHPDSIVTAADGQTYVEDNEGRLHYYSANEGKLHETQILLNMVRSLELINKICNNTVQVEVDNLNLLNEKQLSSNSISSSEDTAENRMRKIQELQDRLSLGSGNDRKKRNKGRLSKAERLRNMQAGKLTKEQERQEKKVLEDKDSD